MNGTTISQICDEVGKSYPMVKQIIDGLFDNGDIRWESR